MNGWVGFKGLASHKNVGGCKRRVFSKRKKRKALAFFTGGGGEKKTESSMTNDRNLHEVKRGLRAGC